MISLKYLQNAILVAEHRNFHRAAQAGHISQPALSRSIQALEQQLGVTLFHRGSGGAEPTLFGKALVARASVILDETEELQREIALLQGLETGVLRVAAGAHAADLSAGPAMGELIARHPSLTCRLELANWRVVAELVTLGRVDLGIAEVSTLELSDELAVESLGMHPLALFVRAAHPLARSTAVSLRELNAFPAVSIRIPPRGVGLFPGLTQLDSITGDLVPAVEVDDFSGALSVVRASNAFSIAAFTQIEHAVRTGEVAVLPYSADWLRLHYGFIYLRRRMLSPAANAYMALVREIEQAAAARNRAVQQELLGLG